MPVQRAGLCLNLSRVRQDGLMTITAIQFTRFMYACSTVGNIIYILCFTLIKKFKEVGLGYKLTSNSAFTGEMIF